MYERVTAIPPMRRHRRPGRAPRRALAARAACRASRRDWRVSRLGDAPRRVASPICIARSRRLLTPRSSRCPTRRWISARSTKAPETSSDESSPACAELARFTAERARPRRAARERRGQAARAVRAAAHTANSKRVQIRGHGDLHLNRMLFTGKDFVIIGLGGGRERRLSERRRKRGALRDVAGIVRSFHYAAATSLLGLRPEDQARAEPWGWIRESWASAAFLRGYLDTAKDAVFVPNDPISPDAPRRGHPRQGVHGAPHRAPAPPRHGVDPDAGHPAPPRHRAPQPIG